MCLYNVYTYTYMHIMLYIIHSTATRDCFLSARPNIPGLFYAPWSAKKDLSFYTSKPNSQSV